MSRTLQVFNIANQLLYEGEKRLDASYYAADIIAARQLLARLKKKGIMIKRIDHLSDKVFWPGRFKRQYASKNDGTPFLMPKEALMFVPRATKFVRDFPPETLVEENWILVTRSGSIGRCLLVTSMLKNFILSDDLIRILPKKGEKVGYLCAFLTSWIGQALLTKDEYGITVSHIEPHHVASIEVPIVSKILDLVNDKVIAAYRLRGEAQQLLSEAEKLIYKKLGLPEIDEEDVDYFGKEGSTIKSFITQANLLDLRLDASYHSPILKILKKNLTKCRCKVSELGALCEVILPPRFKRPYVDKGPDGLPFLSGSHLVEIKPFDVKYLSKSFRDIETYKVKANDVLLSARGTIGRPYLVTDKSGEIAGSDNLIRCIPNQKSESNMDSISSAFLTAWLLTPYASIQLQAQKAGSMQDLVQPAHVKSILVPIPAEPIQKEIGKLVEKASRNRDEANKIEEEAVTILEDHLMKLAGITH